MKKQKMKYDYQRVEQRKTNNVDKKGEMERRQMEKQTTRKISIGTLTFFRPKPTSKVGEFTLAFSKSLPKSEVYPLIKKIFEGNVNEETVKSVFIKLKEPIQFREIRKTIKQNFDKIL